MLGYRGWSGSAGGRSGRHHRRSPDEPDRRQCQKPHRQKIAKTHKRREEWILTGYLIAAQKKTCTYRLPLNQQSGLDHAVSGIGRPNPTEQTLFFNNLMDSVEGHKVGLIEGGTGIGKTLAMLASANEVALSQVTKCNICVPTLSLIYQFAAEYARLAKNAEMAPLKVVMGMREFVDIEALRKLLDEPDYSQHKEVVDQWLEAGAPASGRAENIRTHLVGRCQPVRTARE